MRKADYVAELGIRSPVVVTNLPIGTRGIGYRSQSTFDAESGAFLVLAADDIGFVRELARTRLYEAGFPQWDRLKAYQETRTESILFDQVGSVSPSAIQWPLINTLTAKFMQRKDWRTYFENHLKMIEDGIRNHSRASAYGFPEQSMRCGLLCLLRYVETISAVSGKYLNQYADRLQRLREDIKNLAVEGGLDFDRQDPVRTREIIERHAAHDPSKIDLDEIEKDMVTLANGLIEPEYKFRINRSPFPSYLEGHGGVKFPAWQLMFSRKNSD